MGPVEWCIMSIQHTPFTRKETIGQRICVKKSNIPRELFIDTVEKNPLLSSKNLRG
jgi:hypothetical protein